MSSSLSDWAAERGYRVAWGKPSIVEEARLEIEKRRAAGELDEGVYRAALDELKCPAQAEASRFKWLLVFAVPSPAYRLTFNMNAGTLQTLIPPTYRFYRPTFERVVEDLRATLIGKEDCVVPLWAPMKTIASRLGLVTYGRNNVTYADGFGSYHQLVGCLTDADLDLQPEEKRPPSLAPECRSCRACLKACPTGAISKERILLHAERCLTAVNEVPGAWPEWVRPSAHNCLVGCLACQRVCPKNAGLLREEPIEEAFSRQDTERILSEEPSDDDPAWRQIKAKIARIGLPRYDVVLGRNLRALLDVDASSDQRHRTSTASSSLHLVSW